MNFREKFPRLYALSNLKDAKVADMWRVDGVDLDWRFTWRRRLFVWEEGLLNDLILDLNGFEISQGEDEWRWNLENHGVFTVSSTYKKLANIVIVETERVGEENRVFAHMWKCSAPSKVAVLSWKGFHNRLSTRVNLIRRNAFPPDAISLCVFCNDADESTNHLFLHCDVSWKIWAKVQSLIDGNFIMTSNLFSNWRCWDGLASNRKKLKNGMQIIWHTTIWVIWKFRNNIIFNNGSIEVEEAVKETILLFWRWSLAGLKIQPCLFYEWRWNPRWCLGVLG